MKTKPVVKKGGKRCLLNLSYIRSLTKLTRRSIMHFFFFSCLKEHKEHALLVDIGMGYIIGLLQLGTVKVLNLMCFFNVNPKHLMINRV